jgi:hypothetical protein
MLARKVQATAIANRVSRGRRGVNGPWNEQIWVILASDVWHHVEMRWFMQEQETSNKARMIGYAIGIVCVWAVVAWKLVVR